ncbi:MAG TPA: hypothetical protein PLM82_13025 [Candidatus Latescibacteria bacterium]|nr:hypothetical protein [Candidatus Latescibacterota bacterium]
MNAINQCSILFAGTWQGTDDDSSSVIFTIKPLPSGFAEVSVYDANDGEIFQVRNVQVFKKTIRFEYVVPSTATKTKNVITLINGNRAVHRLTLVEPWGKEASRFRCPNTMGGMTGVWQAEEKDVAARIEIRRKENSGLKVSVFDSWTGERFVVEKLKIFAKSLRFDCTIPTCGTKTRHALKLLKDGRMTHAITFSAFLEKRRQS